MLTLHKKLALPEVLPSWMYKNPLEIFSQLQEAAHRREVERKNKHRRIQMLTREAMK